MMAIATSSGWASIRLEDGSIIGVVNDQGYEGESYKVITFRDEQSRVVVDVYGGGC